MDPEALREHVRRLNEQEQVEIQQRRQRALERIHELREELKYKEQEKLNGVATRIPFKD